jgi:hypothetical protein
MRSPTDSLPCALTDLSIFFLMVKERFPTPFIFRPLLFLRNTEVRQLRYERDRISGVLLQDGSLLQADWYVAALPPHQLMPLLPERWLTRYAYFEQLAEL